MRCGEKNSYLLQATIRKVDEELATRDVAVSGLRQTVVVLGVIIQHPGEYREIKTDLHPSSDTVTRM